MAEFLPVNIKIEENENKNENKNVMIDCHIYCSIFL